MTNSPVMTVITNEQETWLPDPSVKVYVTWVDPRRKKVPGEYVEVTVGAIPELSVTTGVLHVTVVPADSRGTSAVMSAGQVRIWGGS